MVQYKNKLNWHCSKKSCSAYSATIDRRTYNLSLSTPLEGNYVHIDFGKQTSKALIDTGAQISCMSEHIYRKSFKNYEIRLSSLANIVGVCGEVHRILGLVTVPFRLDGVVLEHTFHLFEKLHQSVILGMDFLRQHKAKIDLEECTVSFKSTNYGESRENNEEPSVCHISLGQEPRTCVGLARTVSSVIIEPHSECTLPVKISFSANSAPLVDDSVLLEPTVGLNQENLVGSKCLSSVDHGSSAYRVLNPTNYPVFLKEDFVIAISHLVDEQNIQQVTDHDEQASVNLLDASVENESEVHYENIAKDLGLNLDNSELSEEQKQKLYTFLGRNRDIFAKDSSELTEAKLHKHVIHTTTEKPVSRPPYRQTPKMREETERQTKEMLANGIVRESDTPWHSPIVLVKKRNGEYRFAIDYRELNKITEPISFTIPTITEVFDTLADSKAQIFSLCDLRSGFHQIGLCPSTAEKASFITHKGVFTPTRLQFGLKNSPMCFQNLMSKVLKDLNWKIALVYIDDILIFSKNFDEHLGHLEQVFQNLRAANLKIHPRKCRFAVQEIVYLAHRINSFGIKIDDSKYQAIETYPVPRNVKNVRAFLGMAQFYRRYIKSFATIALPLNKLLRKDNKFVWTEDCQVAFETLKKALVTAPVQAFPQFDKPFILAVDASDESIGYVLSQLDADNREHPVAYGGRALHNEELRWHITDKEGLSLVEAIRQFRPYLANVPFTVYTDNVSVKYFQQIKDCQGRFGRWSLLLQGYNMQIIHKSSRNNANADGLSRRSYPPSPEVEEEEPEVCSVGYEVSFCYANDPNDIKVQSVDPVPAEQSSDKQTGCPNLIRRQQKCPDFKAMYTYKTTGEVPDDAKQARTLVAEASQYEVINGLLYHFYSPRSRGLPKEERFVKQLALPKVLRDDILRSYHDSLAGGGHQGHERTFAAIRLKYYWPKMYDEIGKYVQTCLLCQQVKRPVHAKPPPLQPLPVADLFSRWHIDILSGLPTTKDKYKHILVVVDSYSKWMEAHPLRSQEATEVAAVLYREVITRYGAPRTLISDRGQTFMSKLTAAMCELFQITRHYVSAYHPATNSVVERANSIILQGFRMYCKDQQDDWPEILPSVMMAHRMTPCTQASQVSPFFLLFGREMHIPIDTALLPKDNLSQNHKVHLNNVLKQLETTRKIATENIKSAQVRYKHQFDKRSQVPKFQPAERVWLYCTKVAVGKAPKLHRKWVGPYYITQLGPHHTFKVRNCATNKEVKSLVNGVRLKPYYDPENRPTNPPVGMEDIDEELDAEELVNEYLDVGRNIDHDQAEPIQARAEANTGRKIARNQVWQEANTDQNIQRDNQVQEEANTGRKVQNKAQQQSGRDTDKQVENQTQKKTNTDNRVENQAQKRPNTGKSDNSRKQTQSSLVDNVRKLVDRKNQEKSQTTGKGKKPQGKGSALQEKQPLQPKTSPREIRQSDSRPLTPEPLPGPSHESDESLANRERQDGQLREAVSNKMFSVEDIDKLLSSRRSNGILYYRVKWKHPGSGSTWEYASSIPQVIIREFHASRTMSGKKRRRPLKGKHKFFEKTGSQNSSQDTSDENRRQNNSSHSEVQSRSRSSHSEVQNCKLHPEVQGSNSLHTEVQRIGSCLHTEVQNCRLHSEVQNCTLHSEVQSRGSCLHPEVQSQGFRLHSEVINNGNGRLHTEMQNDDGNSHPRVQNTQQNGRSNTRKSNEYMGNGKKNDTQVHNVMSASETHTNQENEQDFVNSKPRMVGVKLIRDRSFYLVQYGCIEPDLQSASMAHWYARGFITHLIELRREDSIQNKIDFIRNKNKVPRFDPLKTVMSDTIHEVRRAVDGSWEFLLTFRSLDLSPQWKSFENLSPDSINRLISSLQSDYYRALGKRQRY